MVVVGVGLGWVGLNRKEEEKGTFLTAEGGMFRRGFLKSTA